MRMWGELRLWKGPVDQRLLLAAMTLVGVGLVMVFSASAVLAAELTGDPTYYVRKQALWGGAGLVAMVLGARIRLTRLQRVARPLLLLACVALLALWIPGIGRTVGGARRWIMLPMGVGVVQPSEFLKIAMIVYLADRLTRSGSRPGGGGAWLSAAAVTAIPAALLMLQPDFGTAALLLTLCWLMLVASGAPMAPLAGLAGGAMAFGVIAVASSGYRIQRWLAFLDPWRAAKGKGYQMTQSFMAIGSGGVFGVGLSDSTQKLLYLPAPHTDFIFSIIGEEGGLLGGAAVCALFAYVCLRGWRIAKEAATPFSQSLALGVTLLIGVEALLNLGVATGLLPTKGTTLPLLSYGGSSLVAHLLAVGLLLNVSRETMRTRPDHA